MEQNKKGFFAKLKKRFKIFSIITTLIINLSYIAYLAYSLNNDVGIRWVNIALITGTSIFLAAYLIIKLVGVGNIKSTKKFYKRFKLVTKLFSSLTAIYTIITASSVSPFALYLSIIGAAILLVRILIDLIISLIVSKTKKAIRGIKDKRARRKNQREIEKMGIEVDDFCDIDQVDEEEEASTDDLLSVVDEIE